MYIQNYNEIAKICSLFDLYSQLKLQSNIDVLLNLYSNQILKY